MAMQTCVFCSCFWGRYTSAWAQPDQMGSRPGPRWSPSINLCNWHLKNINKKVNKSSQQQDKIMRTKNCIILEVNQQIRTQSITWHRHRSTTFCLFFLLTVRLIICMPLSLFSGNWGVEQTSLEDKAMMHIGYCIAFSFVHRKKSCWFDDLHSPLRERNAC